MPTNPTRVFEAIASPARRELLDHLRRGEQSVSALVRRARVTQSAVSQHLAVLRSAGLVAERREGRFRYYRLQARPLGGVDAWLARFRAHLGRELDQLGRVLDTMDEAVPPRQPLRGGSR